MRSPWLILPLIFLYYLGRELFSIPIDIVIILFGIIIFFNYRRINDLEDDTASLRRRLSKVERKLNI